MPPLPWDRRDSRANTQKLLFEDSFVNLTQFAVKDVQFSIKSTKINNIHKIHAPKIQGRVFSEVAEAPQADTTRRTVLGDPETGKKGEFYKYIAEFVDIFDIFSKLPTFQNVEIEILKCAWEQFPHVQKSRYG